MRCYPVISNHNLFQEKIAQFALRYEHAKNIKEEKSLKKIQRKLNWFAVAVTKKTHFWLLWIQLNFVLAFIWK